jgi:hypothetical protein
MPNREALGEFEHIVLLAVARLGEAAYGVSIRDEIKTCMTVAPGKGAIMAVRKGPALRFRDGQNCGRRGSAM